MLVSWIEKLLPGPALKKALSAGSQSIGNADQIYTHLRDLSYLPAIGVKRSAPAEGIWQDPNLLAALDHLDRQIYLRLKNADSFVLSHAPDSYDLDLTWHAAWAPDQPPLESGEFNPLNNFFLKAVRDPATAVWTARVLDEGRLHLHMCQADAHMQQAHLTLAPALVHLREQAATGVIDANLGLLDLLYQLGDLADFDAAYDMFRRQHPEGATLGVPWRAQLLAEGAFQKQYLGKFVKLLGRVITVRQLRHLKEDPLLEEVQRVYLELTARPAEDKGLADIREVPGPAAVLPTPLLFGFKLPPPEELARLNQFFRKLLPGLNPADPLVARRQAVLGLWTCFVLRHSLDLALCQRLLSGLTPDSEALGLLLGALEGEVAYYAGDYEDAYLAFQRAYTLAADLLARHGPGDLDESRRQAAQLFLGRVCQWHGNALFYLADYRAAEEAYRQAQQHLPADDPETAVLQAINLGNLAFLSNNLVDHRGYVTYAKAEQVLLKGEEPEPFLRLKYDKNRAALQHADQHYQHALELLAALPASADPRSWQAMIKASLGNVRWVKASLLHEAALAAPKLSAELADLGAPEDLYRQALELLSEANELAAATSNQPLQGACLAGMSELQLLLGEFQQAEQTALKCLMLLGDSSAAPGEVIDPVAQQGTFYPENCWRVYLTLARSYEKQAQPDQAESAYQRALQIVEAMRTMLRSDQWQVAALQDKLEVYECYAHFLYHTDRQSNAPKIFELAEKLKARSFLDLLENARLDLEDLMPAPLREQRQALAAEFSARNTAIAQELRQAAANPARVDQLLQDQRDLATRWQALHSEINAAVADQAQELNPAPLSWPDAQALLADQPDLVVLSYIGGNDHSYLLVADAGGLAAFELPGRAAIEFAVGRLVWYAQRTPLRFAEFFKANRATVEIVLGPAIQAGLVEQIRDKRVLIIPDGMLHYLPFEMLLALPPLDRAGQMIDPATYRVSGPDKPKNADELALDLLPFYLLGHCAISYAPSLSVWQMLQRQQIGPAERLALGVYKVNYAVEAPKGPGHQRAQELGIAYIDLPQTERIARVLALFDQPAGADSQVLALSAWNDDQTPWPPDRQSNERNFKQLLEQHSVRYLIFAGHGVFNDKYPSFSGLVFNLASPCPEDLPADEPPQDGFFSLNDIFSLRMRSTELTFLAACQGGLGTLSRGEGVNAITRGLMYRGSPSVIASLWCVDVLATMDLTEAFFSGLQQQPEADKGRVLQAAKQALCANQARPHFAHPYYWAPFVLMGKR